MQIDKDGLKLSKAEEIFQIWEKRLQKKFGADFYIKPEGVIDNIAFSFIWMEMSLQEQIAFLAKQFDPETAEGKWQDALYQRIGIKRMAAQTTLFTKKIKGVPGYKGAPNTIFIHSLPLHLYKSKSEGKEKAKTHPLYSILHDEPNPEMTSFVFRETLMSHLLIWGNAYAQIIRNGKGEVLSLYLLLPNKMSVERDSNGIIPHFIYLRIMLYSAELKRGMA